MDFSRRQIGKLLLFAMLFGLVPGTFSAQEAVPEHQPPAPQYRSAEQCAECHSAIRTVWASSMHALAVTDPVFQASLRRAEELYGAESRKYCLSCHAPTTQITGDLGLKDPVSREGITCDFCHTVTAVTESKPQNSFQMQLGDTKFGPHQNMKPVSGLEFRYSTLHESSLLCAGCHELESPFGVQVLGTYSEWNDSPYAQRGIQCRNCHMPETLNVPSVDRSVRANSPNAHAHEFLGGHSQIRLENAATLVISCLQEAGRIRVDAYVTNEEAGHAMPTGIPVRKIVLTVALKDPDGKILDSSTQEYAKVVEDRGGNVLTAPEKVMTEAFKVRRDNRILPKETRHEVFQFEGYPMAESYIVAADLKYYFQTAEADAASVSIPMVATVSTVRTTIPEGPVRWIFLILISAVLLAVLFLIITSAPKQKKGR